MADAELTTVIRSFKYRLRATKAQHQKLDAIRESQQQLYNGALEHRISAYRKGVNISFFTQVKELTELRTDAEYSSLPLVVQRWTLARLDNAFKDYFSRLKSGRRAGYPRFRNAKRWNTFGFSEWKGISCQDQCVRFKGLPGNLRINLHRELPSGKPLSCTFTRDTKGWFVCLKMRVPIVSLPQSGRKIGIDMGLTHLAALSTGETVPNIRIARRHERDLRRRQRALSRCKRGSKRRRKVKAQLTRSHAKIKDSRRTYLHQVSAKLVREYDFIAIENLNVKGLARSRLAKSVHDAAWATLRTMLTYKAESAGKTVVAVDPKRTSQECSGCGSIVLKTLSQRTHECPDCGLVLDRDHNAAINILARGRSGSRVRQRKAAAST